MASAAAASANVTPLGSLDEDQVGFPKEILGTELEGKYLCSECGNILRRPFQAQCGHRYCASCLQRLISSGPQKCGACIQEGIYEDGVSILETGSAFPDNAARREVESLPAICANEGCAWKGTIKEYESGHGGSCPWALATCPSCRGPVRRRDQERHAARECPQRSLSCKFCKALCHFPQIKAHDEVCPKFPLTCEGCGKRKIPREKFPEHVKSCSKCKAPCRFQPIGCNVVVENESLPEHEGRSLAEHLYLLLGFVLSLRPEPPRAAPFSGPGPLSVPEEGSPLQLRGGGPLLLSGPEPPGFLELLGRCQVLEQKAATFENIVCVLNREVERGALAAEAHLHQHRLDQEKIEALSTKVRQLERSLASKDLALAEMEHSLQEMEAASFDGIFIWKISDFAKKRQEAVAGRSPAIFSPAFYTGKYGYKMCLRIYLNGDGTGRGTHLSLFFVVMRGPCDALLRWPFNQKVTLMLLDQNHREHVIDAFRPDVSSSSFQRPVSDMNIASGCPLFCPLSVMESQNSYLRDDTIFVKAIVDLAGL
ncbi:TNF receptor-associated factor 2 isoform X2 [Anolis carolinensis]